MNRVRNESPLSEYRNEGASRAVVFVWGAMAIAAMCALFMALAPTAKADFSDGYDHQFQGRIGKSNYSYIGFDLKGNKLKKTGVAIPIVCGDSTMGSVLAFPRAKKAIKVKYANGSQKGSFSATVPSTIPAISGSAKITIKGTVKGKRMKGTVSVRANLPPYGKCFSGLYKWSAKRGKNVDAVTVS